MGNFVLKKCTIKVIQRIETLTMKRFTILTNWIINILIGVYCILLGGCVDKIDFVQGDNLTNKLAIQGTLIIGNPSQVKVTLRKVFDFKTGPKFVSAKEVLLIDKQEQFVKLSTRQEGVFSLEIPTNHAYFKIEEGNAFKIRVIMGNNTIYESTYDPILRVPAPDSVSMTIYQETVRLSQIPEDTIIVNHLSFHIHTPIKIEGANEKSRLLWTIEHIYKLSDAPEALFEDPPQMASCFYLDRKTYEGVKNKTCYMTLSPVNNYFVKDGTKISVDHVSEKLYEVNTSLSAHLYAEGGYINVYQQALSESAFQYFAQISQLGAPKIGLIDEPGGAIVSNISNVNEPEEAVFGFFYATSQTTARYYIPPSLANNPFPYCPRDAAVSHIHGDPQCCDCLSEENSITKKPDWWVK